jgi:hypothetical protein
MVCRGDPGAVQGAPDRKEIHMMRGSVRWLVLALSVWWISSTSPAQNVQIDFGIGAINLTDSSGNAIQPPQDFTPCLSALTFACNNGTTAATIRINQDPISEEDPVVEAGVAAQS